MRIRVRRESPDLTARQGDVVALLVEGLSHREIGERLAISTHTVAHHAQAAMHAGGYATERRLLAAVWAARVLALLAEIVALKLAISLIDQRRGGRRQGDA